MTEANHKHNQNRRYLVVGPSWIGDMVMAQSLFISLARQYPDCSIDVLAPGWSLPVLARMPQVRQGIDADVSHGEFSLGKRRRLGKSLRKNHYTHAIVLPRSWKSALVPYFAGVPVRTGYRGEMRYGLLNDIRPLDKTVLTQTVQRYVALGSDPGQYPGQHKPGQQNGQDSAAAGLAPEIPLPALTSEPARLQQLDQALGDVLGLNASSKDASNKQGPVVCMMPGAEYGPAKQWPLEYYGKLAARIVKAGGRVWVLGSQKDAGAGDIIGQFCSEGLVNLCGRTSLVDAIDLLAAADAAVSNDSGLMHVAAAVGTRLSVIYGSSTPDYTPPLATADKRTIFYLGLDCSPCFKRECPLGHTRCLTDITEDAVYQSLHL